MEGLFGFLVFLVIAAVSIASKSGQQKRGGGSGRPQWPGPVAGGPGFPNFPRPPEGPTTVPQRPTSFPQRPTAPPQLQPRSQQPQRPPSGRLAPAETNPYRASTAGAGMEVIGTEGPAESENVFTELDRFGRALAEDINVDRDLPVEDDLNADRNIKPLEMQRLQLAGTMAESSEAAPTVSVDRAGDKSATGLGDMLSDPGNMAQAIVLAEILSKPKALRGRSLGRR